MLEFSTLCEYLVQDDLELVVDSRLVKGGEVFIALPKALPSHLKKEYIETKYLDMAISQNISHLVLEKEHFQILEKEGKIQEKVNYVLVDDTRQALGILAKNKYKNYNLDFPIIAITGTNGKTTCSYLLEYLYKSKGKNVAVLGTISYRWNNYCQDAPLTTPDCLTLHKIIAKAREDKVDALIMEVSSHALDQNRLAGIEINAVLFTNLTQDHLDYHENMENYFHAKLRLFTELPMENKIMSIYGADFYGKKIIEKSKISQSYGLYDEQTENDYALTGYLKSISTDGFEIEHEYQGKHWTLNSSLVGKHNALNVLGVECLALQLGFKVDDMQELAKFMGVLGRLERISAPVGSLKEGISFFVDYAHTPDALVKAQEALIQAGFNRIITVFGCGGDRDKTKRPLMGEAVAGKSDIVIVTSDNPRTENPDDIINDIIPGLEKAKKYYAVTDRREAIKLAVDLSEKGDAVLVAGKGHENYQIIGKEKTYFSDQDIIKDYLANY